MVFRLPQAGKAGKTLTVLLLDEVGLAENSPHMPLKVLHTILVDPPIAIVGLSNWVLDSAKMNRAVCLQRPDPSEDDLASTGGTIVHGGSGSGGGGPELQVLLGPLARAFREVYTAKADRAFVGMRDYFCLLKLLRRAVKGPGGRKVTSEVLTWALCRSFGGKPALLDHILRTFHERVAESRGGGGGTSLAQSQGHAAASMLALRPPPPRELISDNLKDGSARHLLLLTRNGAALSLLFGCGLVPRAGTTVLVGSEFEDDAASDFYLVSQVTFLLRLLFLYEMFY